MIVPFFGLGQQGKSPTVTAQRHLNLYAEIQAEGEKGQIAFYGTPGTIERVSFGDTPIRGWIAIGTLYYLVHRGTFYDVNNAGVKTARGTIDTTVGRVDMSYDGSVILITTGTSGYTYTISTLTLTKIASVNFPQTAKTCTWLDGQFVVDDGISDSFYISNDGTTWDALDFATAESNPDGLVRVFADNGEIILGGESTIEFWGNVGAADFPFAAIKGSTQEFGLAARWSLCKFNSGLAGLFKSKMGQVQVMFIRGYVPKPVSTQEIDSIINSYTAVSDATAYSYLLGGHPMLQLNFPSVGKSWLYDASSGLWSPLEYGLEGERHRGEMHIDFLNRPLIADYASGIIYELNENTYTDNGVAITREIVSRHIYNNNEWANIDQLYVDMEVGVGLPGNIETTGQNYLNLPGASGDYVSTPDSAVLDVGVPAYYGNFPGASGDYISTPDSAALDVLGDIELIAYAAATVWTPAAAQVLFAKFVYSTPNRSYQIFLNTNGKLTLETSYDGTNAVSGQSTVAPSITDGSGLWIKANLDVNDGAGNRVYNFYTSNDPVITTPASVSWTQLGTTVTTAGTTTIFNSIAGLEIGSDNSGDNRFAGKIHRAIVKNGIGGTTVADYNANDYVTGSTFVSSTTGETYTLNGATSVVKAHYGDISLACYAALTDWTPAGDMELNSKSLNTGNQRSWQFHVKGTTGLLELFTSNNGVAVSYPGDANGTIERSTIAPTVSNGSGLWIRADRVGSNTLFYTSTDAPTLPIASISWTQLGTTVACAGTLGMLDSTADYSIGAINASGSTNRLIGKIYRAQVYNGIGGTLVADFNANDGTVGSSTFGSSGTQEIYTINGAASIDGDFIRATQGANPQVMLSYSKNNGKTWSAELWKTLGPIGRYMNRVVWRRLGVSRDWTFKLRISDAVKTVFTFGDLK
jgi:hypothetical protein